jgi:IPT/TIG domain
MKRIALLVALVLTTASLFAAPVATSISPKSGPTAGGTVVTITGSGFSNCIICSPPVPPQVFFGSTIAANIRIIDSTTLVVTTPPLFPATYDVTVNQFDGSTTLRQAFTVTGEISDSFERILIPVYTPPVHGAFGSEFHTIAFAGNKAEPPVTVYGIDPSCLPIDPPPSPFAPEMIPGGTDIPLPSDCSNWPARFFYVPKAQAAALTFNDRVFDISRSALSNGTEIPIVRSDRFTNRIVLMQVPIGGNFRNTLRIYAANPIIATVMIGGLQHIVPLQAGATMFDPAYATFSEFPVPVDPGSATTLRVTIDSPEPVWAFITSTNNISQEITTISPD